MRALTNKICTLSKKDDGSTIVEFALVAPLLAMFLVAIIEFGMIMFSSILMESGLRDASRFGITGRVLTGQTRLESIVQIISDRTIGLVDMNAATVEVLVYPSFSNVGAGENYVDGNANGTYDAGETYTDSNGNGAWDSDIGVAGAGDTGDIVLYRISYDWPLLTPFASHFMGSSGAFSLQASIAVRNEPWTAGGGGA
jgi:Flp pilus assembly protein TadG